MTTTTTRCLVCSTPLRGPGGLSGPKSKEVGAMLYRAIGRDFETVKEAESYARQKLAEWDLGPSCWIFVVGPGVLPAKLWEVRTSAGHRKSWGIHKELTSLHQRLRKLYDHEANRAEGDAE